jgi:hypothetical protein
MPTLPQVGREELSRIIAEAQERDAEDERRVDDHWGAIGPGLINGGGAIASNSGRLSTNVASAWSEGIRTGRAETGNPRRRSASRQPPG